MKDNPIKVCEQRDDPHTEEVSSRITGVNARSYLIQKLHEHFGECLIVLRTEGCVNIIH